MNLNTTLLLMIGVALLLVAPISKGKGATVHKWASIACAVLLSIQPIKSALTWFGGLFGV